MLTIPSAGLVEIKIEGHELTIVVDGTPTLKVSIVTSHIDIDMDNAEISIGIIGPEENNDRSDLPL
jgi:hypothetical protein